MLHRRAGAAGLSSNRDAGLRPHPSCTTRSSGFFRGPESLGQLVRRARAEDGSLPPGAPLRPLSFSASDEPERPGLSLNPRAATGASPSFPVASLVRRAFFRGPERLGYRYARERSRFEACNQAHTSSARLRFRPRSTERPGYHLAREPNPGRATRSPGYIIAGRSIRVIGIRTTIDRRVAGASLLSRSTPCPLLARAARWASASPTRKRRMVRFHPRARHAAAPWMGRSATNADGEGSSPSGGTHLGRDPGSSWSPKPGTRGSTPRRPASFMPR